MLFRWWIHKSIWLKLYFLYQGSKRYLSTQLPTQDLKIAAAYCPVCIGKRKYHALMLSSTQIYEVKSPWGFPNPRNMFDRGLGCVWRTILVLLKNPWSVPGLQVLALRKASTLKRQSHEIDQAHFKIMRRSRPNCEPRMVFKFFYCAFYFILKFTFFLRQH